MLMITEESDTLVKDILIKDILMDSSLLSVRNPNKVADGGILRAFLPDSNLSESGLEIIERRHLSPTKESCENIGSLIENSFDRLIPEALNRSIPTNTRILELGCATGELGNFLSIAGRDLLCVDSCFKCLLEAQRFKEENKLNSVHFAQMNPHCLPLKAETFDLVIINESGLHSPDPLLCVHNACKVLKPGSHLILGLSNQFSWLQSLLSNFSGKNQPGKNQASASCYGCDRHKNPEQRLTMETALNCFKKNGLNFVRSIPSTIFGSSFNLDYKESVFGAESPASVTDRMLVQIQQAITSDERFIVMIARKPD